MQRERALPRPRSFDFAQDDMREDAQDGMMGETQDDMLEDAWDDMTEDVSDDVMEDAWDERQRVACAKKC